MKAAAAVERLWPGRGARWTALGGGITNHNFKVEVDGAAYVLRMGGQSTELLGIDRFIEQAAGRRAAEVGVGPEVHAFVEPEGWLVTRFIDGRPLTPEQVREPATIERVAAALRKVHGAASIPGRFDAHQVIEEYGRVVVIRGGRLPSGFDAAHVLSERIRAARGTQPAVPCHNDLLNANFLDDGQIRIVDWEYAGMGDRFFDLANLSVNHGFELAHDRKLLVAYFGEERPADLAALRVMRLMSDFREAMWGAVQTRISELAFDFEGYAAKHFERLQAAAADPEFEGYLTLCAASASTPIRTLSPPGS